MNSCDIYERILARFRNVSYSNEAAFYGPKIDVQVWSAIGKEFTIATNQVDFAVPENSMVVDPVTDSDEVAVRCYDAMIGSEFEQRHGWHVNLMPDSVLRELPAEWETRATTRACGLLTVTVPSPADLLAPKLRRNEPRDRAHEAWAYAVGLLPSGL